MKLAMKFTVAFLLGMCGVLGVYAYFIAEREVIASKSDMERDQRVLGRATAVAIEMVWQHAGAGEAMDLIRQANSAEEHNRIEIQWRWVDSPDAASPPDAIPSAGVEALRQGRDYAWTDSGTGNAGRACMVVPAQIAGRGLGAVELRESLVEASRYTRATLHTILFATISVGVVSAFLSTLLGLRIVGDRVGALIVHARRVAAGDLTSRLHFRQHDELRELADEFNSMSQQLGIARDRLADETAARIATIQQLRHADRLKTVGQMASGIAHELGTPLNVVWARAKMIAADGCSAGEIQDNARIIAEQTERMTRIIRQLLDFARPRPPHRVTTDLRPIIERTAALLKPVADKRSITIKVESAVEPLNAHVDPDQLQQVLSNLVLNGIQAMRQPGTVVASLGLENTKPPEERLGSQRDYIRISVTDEGEGISEESFRHLFEPFFSTKVASEGTGLGLSVAKGIIADHGGWIAVSSRVGEGSVFSVYLPRGSGDAG
jgi:two-component system, NtrC family, sensor kinase